MTRLYYRSLLLLMACGLLASCNGNYSPSNGSARVTIAVESQSKASSAADAAKAAPRAKVSTRAVASLTLTVTAPDMTTITQTAEIQGAEISVDVTVPNGDNRTFSVELMDASGEAVYGGGVVVPNLSGTPVVVAISVTPLFFTGTRLAGTVDDDYGNAITRDSSGNIYVAGLTYGDFSNPLVSQSANAVGDAYFTKFDVSGAELWTRQFGASASSMANGIAVDGSGNIIVAGVTGADLYGEKNSGYADCFVVKFDSSGNVLWTRLIGGGGDDIGNAVAVDAAGNVYVTGFITSAGAYDVFAAKLDASGSQQWLEQYGSGDFDAGVAIAVDKSGNSYVTGYTYGVLAGTASEGSTDSFISKFDSAGNPTTVQFGGPDLDQTTAIVVDDTAGMLYFTGYTYGKVGDQNNVDPSGGSSDIVVAKFDLNLAEQAILLKGTPGNDTAQGIAVDAAGNVFVVGSTSGAFTGNTNGGYDSFVMKIQPSLTAELEWVEQIGTPNDDDGKAVVLDKKGNPLVAGSEKGDFDGISNSGFGFDAFLMSYDTNGVKQ